MKVHALLSPSSAYRWMKCAGSLRAPPSDESTEYADEGTAAHTLAAWALALGELASKWLGYKIPVCNDDGSVRREFVVDDDMTSYVQVYVDAVRDRIVGSAQLLTEQRLNTGLVSKRYGSINGTGDAVILHPFTGLIEVHDLKFGRGHKVTAKDNPQLLLYALGAMNDYRWMMTDVTRVKVAIHQPRIDHYDEHEYVLAELLDFAAEVRGVIDRLDVGDDSLVPGDNQCRFCPLAASCPALAKLATETALADFASVADLTEWGISKAMDKVELIELWCAAVRAEARRLLDAGTKVPGWMLGEGRQGNRKWTDEKAAEAMMAHLGEVPYEPKTLISPAKAEKKLKNWPDIWASLQSLIVRGPPSVSVMREGDGKASLTSSVANDFKVLG